MIRLCKHNAMIERHGDPNHAWQCADCGYVYEDTDKLADQLAIGVEIVENPELEK